MLALKVGMFSMIGLNLHMAPSTSSVASGISYDRIFLILVDIFAERSDPGCLTDSLNIYQTHMAQKANCLGNPLYRPLPSTLPGFLLEHTHKLT